MRQSVSCKNGTVVPDLHGVSDLIQRTVYRTPPFPHRSVTSVGSVYIVWFCWRRSQRALPFRFAKTTCKECTLPLRQTGDESRGTSRTGHARTGDERRGRRPKFKLSFSVMPSIHHLSQGCDGPILSLCSVRQFIRSLLPVWTHDFHWQRHHRGTCLKLINGSPEPAISTKHPCLFAWRHA